MPKRSNQIKPPPASPAKKSWIQRVGGFFHKSAPASVVPAIVDTQRGKTALTKAESALLPPFPGLPASRIRVPKTKIDCEAAANAILAAGVAGFDTESRPTFKAGEKSSGPHVVQFALTDCAYIFQLRHPECESTATRLIESKHVLKVGFGLKNDHGQIRNRLGVKLQCVMDLDQVFRKRGHRHQIGVRGAIAELLHQSFPKSKSTTTSNWSANDLTSRQLIYAANDAYAALKIMEALDIRPGDEVDLYRG